MILLNRSILAALLLALASTPAVATGPAAYAPAKVVYDFSSADPTHLKNLLDRVSLLQNLYASDPFAASVIVVIHEGAVPLFAKQGRLARTDLTQRAQGLTLSDIIQFRLCRASAQMQGFDRNDFDGFIELVPMADAEIVRLQHEGYAYLN
ncbi:MAG: DsrE family protein [Betaproteobacteria bacterium]|nr:MAG: DsrE family protein [Betaproteobacteria bacterium]